MLAVSASRIRRYPLAELKSGWRIDYRVAANWKVILENYNECYHCAGVHPELCRVVPAFRVNGGADLDWEAGIPQQEGTNTFTLSGTTTRAPFPGLDESEKVRHKGELIYPNMMLSLSMDHVAAFTLWPRAPGHTDIVCEFLFHPDEMTKDDFDAADSVAFWDLVNRQDWGICESVQRGMHSSAFTSGFYGPMEDWSLDIRNYVRERIGRD
jgi:Rieske 2Fe-2S family protein